jgi:formylglycine-generating enzyme required for sulfatase activity
MPESRSLRVFLCHASQDKPKVRDLYKRLKSEGWIEPWLDEESLLPGQDFDLEIYRTIRDTDAIIICLSTVSVAKEGYVNKEIRRALDIAEEKPEGTIYVIPLRLDDCSPSFERLRKLHWVNYFTPHAHERLVKSLRARAIALKLSPPVDNLTKEYKPELPREYVPSDFSDLDLDLYRFVQIPQTSEAPYPFWIGKYPITNAQYECFLIVSDYATESYWRGFLKFNEDCIQIGQWRNEGLDWLKEKMGESNNPPLPEHWDDAHFGITNPDNPAVGITWYEANAYCNWLVRHWNELAESYVNSSLRPRLIRLPLDTEWTIAAGGETPPERYPWDTPGKATDDEKEILRRANVEESYIGHTTPVNASWRGASPYEVMDMAGNVDEWQANYHDMMRGNLSVRGGSWYWSLNWACVSITGRNYCHPNFRNNNIGFRVVALPREVSS